jgi:8-oxo-dGTP diphosphatase
LEAAFAREVCEETGLRVDDVQLVRVVSGYRLRLEAFFRARVTGEISIRLQESEVLEARFFPSDALPENILPQQKAIILMATSSSHQ